MRGALYYSLPVVAIVTVMLTVSFAYAGFNGIGRAPAQPHTPGLIPSQPFMHAGNGRTTDMQTQSDSLNWAGYVAGGAQGSVNDAKSSWTVPSLTCSGQTSYAAFWVGIDGFNDSTVEQTGVLAECYHGKPYYYTWYEFYPANPVYVTSQVPVQPGDRVYADVSYANGLFTTTITNENTGATFSASQSVGSAKRSSAEWIAEAPASGGRILPLADFGVADYGLDYTGMNSTNYATINSATGSIGYFEPAVTDLTMVDSNLAIKAQPSPLTADGTSFFVDYGGLSANSTTTSTTVGTTSTTVATTSTTVASTSTTVASTSTTTICGHSNSKGKCIGGPNQ